jgi:hypothetical protein
MKGAKYQPPLPTPHTHNKQKTLNGGRHKHTFISLLKVRKMAPFPVVPDKEW